MIRPLALLPCLSACRGEAPRPEPAAKSDDLLAAGWREVLPEPVDGVHAVRVFVDGNEFEMGGGAVPERWESSDGQLQKLIVTEEHGCRATGTGPMDFGGDVDIRYEATPQGEIAGLVTVRVSLDYTSFEGRRFRWNDTFDLIPTSLLELADNGFRIELQRRPGPAGK